MMKFKQVTIIFLFLLFSATIFAQSNDLFTGIKLRAEVQSLVK
ncbi:MAG: hypothetical protein ABI686_07525 [Acidobacteriota bacterium]